MRRWVPIAAALMAFVLAGAHGADYNNDGMADVLWRLPAGNPLIWQMSGLSIQSQLTVATALNAGSAIVGAGKFFGKDYADAIAWISSGDQLTLWQIGADGNLTKSCTVASGIAPDLDFLGIGDVNGDGSDDVLWRNADDGSVVAFQMDGCYPPQSLTLDGTANAAWTFAGAGDVNGDGSADLIWQDAQGGNLIVWLTAPDGAVTPETFAESAQSRWSVVAIGDFDGNGKADLLWRDPSSQNLVLWSSNGTGFDVAPIEPATADTFAANDDIFGNGFDTSARLAPALSADWTILGAADFNGDGDADILLADSAGDTAIWQMQGASVQATGLFPPTTPDMPLPGLTGWRLPLDRPTITKQNDEVTVRWNALPGTPSYTVYGSNDPAKTGSVVSNAPPPLAFARSALGYASSDRYFAVSAAYHGIALPPSKEAYILEFAPTVLPYWGAMAVTDLNGDGCMDILGALGNCHGGFTLENESSVGLGALRANGRAYRDVRFADFNGDGVLDVVANVYSCDVDKNPCGGNDMSSQILLFFGNGDGTFTEDVAFMAINVPGGGYGETIVVADFNNDGCLDIFLPKYTFYDSTEHNFLLINDCQGHFHDVSDTAGVAMVDQPSGYRPEGAQAVDLNSDGWIDLYTGSHLFMNQSVQPGQTPVFQDMRAAYGVPQQFDEGAKFIDLDHSGQLSLALQTVYSTLTTSPGIQIWTFDGIGNFTQRDVVPPIFQNQTFGLNAADLNGDGSPDLVVAGGCDASDTGNLNECYVWGQPHALPQLLQNVDGQFALVDFYDDGLSTTTRGWNDLQTFADFDDNGTADWVSRFGDTRAPDGGYLNVLMNQASSSDIITITVLGANGEQNQQGRVVRVTPDARPSVTMTQVVDGGSGYMSNGPYDLTFATPYPGAYSISVRFANATYTATARSGEHVTMYANGTVSRY
jgi:hypothetical protein